MKGPLVPVLAVLFAASATAQGWVDRTPISPSGSAGSRAFAAMCWDAAHGYVLMCGGATPGGLGAPNETWTWNGTTWTQRFTTNPPNPGWNNLAPVQTAMAFHAPTNEVLMVMAGNTWTWTGADWFFHPVSIGNPANGVPLNVALGHDPGRNQTVLFVGSRFTSGALYATPSTFVWDGFGWTPRTTAVTPWPVEFPTMAFDPVAGRLVLATNGNGNSAFFEWTGTNWQQRLLAGAPTPAGSMATDTLQQRIVMLDGLLNAQPNHTWTLANGVLQQVSTPIEPTRRFGAAMAYDPVRQRIVMFGGSNYWSTLTLTLGDTWEFELPPGPSYTTYGAGCAGSNGTPAIAAQGSSLPRAGLNFQLHVTNLPLTAPTFLFFGTSDTSYLGLPLPLPLAVLGAPGCSVLSSAEQLHFLTNVLGTAVWNVTSPNFPGASFYNQAIVFDAAANPLGLTTSNGGHGVIGF